MDQGNIKIVNDTVQTGIRLLGFVVAVIFIVLAIKLSWYLLIGLIVSVPFLFTKSGFEINIREGNLEKYNSVFSFKKSSKIDIDQSFKLLFEKGKFLKPIFQPFSLNDEKYTVDIYRLSVSSELHQIVIELPLIEEYTEAKRLAENISESLNIELSTNF